MFTKVIIMLLWCMDDAVVRALASHQCGPGLIAAQCYVWVEFVVGSCLAVGVFLRVVRLSSVCKNQHSKFQFGQDRGPALKPAQDSSVSVVMHLFISLIYPYVALAGVIVLFCWARHLTLSVPLSTKDC